MDFGIALPTAADSWKVTKEAEELGFTHAWFYDTQMLSADCFVAMGAAAVNTKRIRLGTGVLVPSNRIAPVAANALATLNQLAPGRIDFGVGTGFTARRAMGFGAIKVKDMETYIHQVYGLLRRETVEFEMEGEKKKIRFLNPELPLFNTKDPIALHLSAFGPRTRALTAKLKAGWIDFVGKVENGIKEVEAMREAWTKAGHAIGDLQATAFALGCVLKDGEPANSERAMAQAGPRAAVMLHRAADEALAGLKPGVAMLSTPEIQAYIDLARGFEPKDAPYLENHRGHLMFVKAEEKRFVSAELIANTSFTASEAEIKKRIEALRGAGYTPVHHPARARPGTRAGRLGPHPQGVCLSLLPERGPPGPLTRIPCALDHDAGRRPALALQTEIERDGDALGGALIGPHLVDHPCREHHQPAGLGPDALGGARRQAARHGVAEMRRVHRRQRPARIHELELAAQRRIGIDAAIVDVIDARPEGPGMGMEFVAVAAAVDVRPHVAVPGHGKVSGMRTAAGIALAIRRHAVGEVAADAHQLDRRRAAPAIHVPARLPAAEVGVLRAGMGLLSLDDDAAQLAVESRCLRYVEGNERGSKQRDYFGRSTTHVRENVCSCTYNFTSYFGSAPMRVRRRSTFRETTSSEARHSSA